MKILFFVIAFLSSAFAYSQQDSALSFRNDGRHMGIYSKNYSAFGSLLMKFKTSGKIFSSPIITDRFAYVGSGDGNLYAINIQTKKQAWKFLTNGPVHSSPALFKQVIYFGSYDGYFYAVDAISGKLKWKFKTGGERMVGAKGLWGMKPVTEFMQDPFDFFLSSPVIDVQDNLVYFGSGDGNLYALHADNGKLLWKYKTDGIVHSSPVLYNGSVIIGSWDTYLYSIDAKTGKEKWKFKTGADTVSHLLEGIQASPAIYNGLLFFGARDGYFYALETETGKLKWKYSANNSWILTTPTFSNNTVYFGTSDTYQLIALDIESGKEKFKMQANGYVYSSPSIAGHTIFFGDFTGQLFSIDLENNGNIFDKFTTDGRKDNAAKILLKDKIDFSYAAKGLDLSNYSSTVTVMKKLYTLGPILSSPVIYNGAIYFGSADGNLYALKLIDL